MDTIDTTVATAPARMTLPDVLYCIAPPGTPANSITLSRKGILPTTMVDGCSAPAIVGYSQFHDALTAALIATISARHKVRTVLIEPARIAFVLEPEAREFTMDTLRDMEAFVYSVHVPHQKRYVWAPHPVLSTAWISHSQSPFRAVQRESLNHVFNGSQITIAQAGRGIIDVRLSASTAQGYTLVEHVVHVE